MHDRAGNRSGFVIESVDRDVDVLHYGRKEFMTKRMLLIGAVILSVLVAVAWAADVSGKWIAEAPSGQQGTSEITLVFKVDGNTLTGTLDNSQMPGAIEIKDGTVKGEDISFHVLRTLFGENESKIVWKGTVSGDEIKFTRQIEGGMTGGGPGGGQGGPGGGAAATEIIATRAK